MQKLYYNLLSFTKERKQKSNFINNKKYEIMFFLLSGDDSVTLPDSTQPEEPVGGIEKTKKILELDPTNSNQTKTMIIHRT